MNSVSNFLWLDITMPLNRTIHPGQYVQLWMPRTSFRAFFQLPVFYIAFWEDGPTQRTVRMVAEPRLGLLRKLSRCTAFAKQAAGHRPWAVWTPSQLSSVRYNSLRGGGHWVFPSAVIHRQVGTGQWQARSDGAKA